MQKEPRITTLAVLNVFGNRADYIRHFKVYPEDEGLLAEGVEFVLLIKHLDSIQMPRTFRVKRGINFQDSGPKPTLQRCGAQQPISLVIVERYAERHRVGTVRDLDAHAEIKVGSCRSKDAGSKINYHIGIKGTRAQLLMEYMYPLLFARRQAQIQSILEVSGSNTIHESTAGVLYAV